VIQVDREIVKAPDSGSCCLRWRRGACPRSCRQPTHEYQQAKRVHTGDYDINKHGGEQGTNCGLALPDTLNPTQLSFPEAGAYDEDMARDRLIDCDSARSL
jgi:hypothetical protein